MCAFGAVVVPATDQFGRRSDAARRAPASIYGMAEVWLEVSLNAQQFSGQRVPFRYTAASPTIASFSPSSGPSDGDTTVVIGYGFAGGSDYKCKFDSCGDCVSAWSCGPCVVNATYVSTRRLPRVHCAAAGGVAVGCGKASGPFELSLNSQEYTSSAAALAPLYPNGYLYYPTPSLTGASPSLGPASGTRRSISAASPSAATAATTDAASTRPRSPPSLRATTSHARRRRRARPRPATPPARRRCRSLSTASSSRTTSCTASSSRRW